MVLININCCLKGCVRGYGNYEELTSSGVDPTELFDDIEDCGKSPDLVQPDIVIEECDDIVEEAGQQEIKTQDHTHLIIQDKNTKRYAQSNPSEAGSYTNFDPKFDRLSEEVSLFTAPSLFSLVSSHDNLDSIRRTKRIIKVSTPVAPMAYN